MRIKSARVESVSDSALTSPSHSRQPRAALSASGTEAMRGGVCGLILGALFGYYWGGPLGIFVGAASGWIMGIGIGASISSPQIQRLSGVRRRLTIRGISMGIGIV